MRGPADPQSIAAKRARRKRKYLQHSKATKNYTLAVSRLPDDVLEDIFFRCGPHPVDLLRSWKGRRGVRNEDNGNCFSYEKPWMSYGNIIRFSHVCQRWRRIIRSAGAFWSYRAISPRSNMPSALIKSLVLDALFVIDLVLGSGESLQPWVRDPKTIARTSVLQAVISTSKSRNFAELIKTAPAPALESLTVASTRNGHHYDQDVGLGRISDPTLFADTVPLLRSVCLISVRVPSNSTILRNLTSLCLCNTDVTGDSKDVDDSRLGHILSVISRCPGLENLVLDKSLPKVIEPPNAARIVLPFLSRLTVLGTSQATYVDGRTGYCLMSCLDHPPLSKLHVGHSPPVAMSAEELIPETMRVAVGDANALIINFHETITTRGVENVEIKFGVVNEACLSSKDESPSQNFSQTSSVMYTIDHNETYSNGWSDMAAIVLSFIHRYLGSKRKSIMALSLELGTRLHGRYRKHKPLHLEKLFGSLPELKVLEVRCALTTMTPLQTEYTLQSEYRQTSSKTSPVLSDIQPDDGLCTDVIHVWALGEEIAEALHSAVVCAEKATDVGEGESAKGGDAKEGREGKVVLPRLTRISFTGAYFNTASTTSQLKRKKSWNASPAFEHLLNYVEHRALNAVEASQGVDETKTSAPTSTSSFTFTASSLSAPPPEVQPRSIGRSIPSLQFSGCFGVRDEYLEKLANLCGANIMSPHALRVTRLHAGALDWDMRDPWYVPLGTPEDDEEIKRETPETAPVESQGEGSSDPVPTSTQAELAGMEAAPADGNIERAENVALNATDAVSYGIQALDLAI
ncbi:hypothetical protein SCHPADRAFT_940820 [Schizopora paradoxa]|uniref:F-box domain-containing protein n=1 Tax=Schizopora paradoxa TaxID=27342 RepID=A0A0H2RLY9_9AGAM|nr:hypothetical protein SCHPADRAFT_940820 [Schizopora paradoxa]